MQMLLLVLLAAPPVETLRLAGPPAPHVDFARPERPSLTEPAALGVRPATAAALRAVLDAEQHLRAIAWEAARLMTEGVAITTGPFRRDIREARSRAIAALAVDRPTAEAEVWLAFLREDDEPNVAVNADMRETYSLSGDDSPGREGKCGAEASDGKAPRTAASGAAEAPARPASRA